jgi:hypothetical protein
MRRRRKYRGLTGYQQDETVRNCILIYIQQDEKIHGLFYLETTLHVSGGTATHHQERKQLYVQLFVLLMMGGVTTQNM